MRYKNNRVNDLTIAARKFTQFAAQFKTQAAEHQYLTGALFVMFAAGKTLNIDFIPGALLSLGATLLLFRIWKE